jgi:hypothetical protein
VQEPPRKAQIIKPKTPDERAILKRQKELEKIGSSPELKYLLKSLAKDVEDPPSNMRYGDFALAKEIREDAAFLALRIQGMNPRQSARIIIEHFNAIRFWTEQWSAYSVRFHNPEVFRKLMGWPKRKLKCKPVK